MRAARGFTLIEVLVALAIVTIGMAAVLEALTSSARATLYLRQKTFAEWVALNRIEHVRLSGAFPRQGTKTGHVEFAKRKWEWRQRIRKTLVAGVRRIVVSTRPAKDEHQHGWSATATGYVGRAIAQPNPLSPQWIPGPIAGVPTGTGAGNANSPLTRPLALP